MSVPTRFPGLKVATILLSAYAAVWIALEGALWQVMVMGIGVTLVAAGHLTQRYLGGHTFSVKVWVGLTAVFGLLIGISCAALTLAFMAVKTGLHAHGPEFTLVEISWVIQQLPLWGIIGLLVGTAVGLLSIGLSHH